MSRLPLLSLQRSPSVAPLSRLLDRRRLYQQSEVLEELGDTLGALHQVCDADDTEGSDWAFVNRVATGALTALRHRSEGHWSPFGIAAWVDRFIRGESPEILDGDGVDPEARRDAMSQLDGINRAAGLYLLWEDEIERALGASAGGHIHELACGHGGLSTHLSARGAHRISASDVDPEHVALARERSPKLAVSVGDATALGTMEDVDLFVCAQAAHHFSPGLLVRVMAEAVKYAPKGLLLIDIHRSLALMPVSAINSALTGGRRIILLDGLTSVRRSYTPAELSLLAALAGVEVRRAGPLGPAHLFMHVSARR